MFPATRDCTRWMYARLKAFSFSMRYAQAFNRSACLMPPKVLLRGKADADASSAPDLHHGRDDLEEKAKADGR